MKILFRILTAVVLFIFLFIVFAMGTLMIGGAIAGMLNASAVQATGFNEGYAAGQEAGRKFGASYGTIIFLISFIVAILISAALSFSNIFPWCRTKSKPPVQPQLPEKKVS